MKKKIVVKKSNNQLHFYLVIPKYGSLYLFSTKFSKGVYSYFSVERAEREILSFNKWGINPRLDKIITRIPSHIRYATNEILMNYQDNSNKKGLTSLAA